MEFLREVPRRASFPTPHESPTFKTYRRGTLMPEAEEMTWHPPTPAGTATTIKT